MVSQTTLSRSSWKMDKQRVKREAKSKNLFTLEKKGEQYDLEANGRSIQKGSNGSEWFVFKELAPGLFRNLRKKYEISDEEIAMTFGRENFDNLDIRISAMKGGAFFIKPKSHSSLLIKSATNDEYETLKKLIGSLYLHHMRNPKSLLAPILGIFTLSLDHNEEMPPIHFFIMKSVTHPSCIGERDKVLVFDLKGAKINRRLLDDASVMHNLRECDTESLGTMLDIDFENGLGRLLVSNPTKVANLLRQVGNDTQFLR